MHANQSHDPCDGGCSQLGSRHAGPDGPPPPAEPAVAGSAPGPNAGAAARPGSEPEATADAPPPVGPWPCTLTDRIPPCLGTLTVFRR